MATGRTLPAWQRIFIDGYPMCAYAIDTGEQIVDYGGYEFTALCDAITGVIPGQPTITFGPLNGIFDNTAASGLHVLSTAAQGAKRDLMLAYGIRATPAVGDPVFCAPMMQTAYKAVSAGAEVVTVEFKGPPVTSALVYDEFFGLLAHAYGAETGANVSNTPNLDNGASSAYGGWLMYQVNAIAGGVGTATISIDDSADGLAWAALAGATSGALGFASAPTSGIVQLGATATVRRYLRWQLALAGGATGATFALAWMRGRSQ